MLNHICIMGRFTRAPELRRTGNGTAVTGFTLAVDRDFPDKDTGERGVDFLDCVAWRGTGEFVAKYFQKGSLAVVSGRLQIRSWTDKDGGKRRTAEVVADNVYFGGSKKDSGGSAESYSAPVPQRVDADSFDPENPYAGSLQYAQNLMAGGGVPQDDYAYLDDDVKVPF